MVSYRRLLKSAPSPTNTSNQFVFTKFKIRVWYA